MSQFGDARPLTLEGGKDGRHPRRLRCSRTTRLRPLEGTIFSVTITGPRIVTESDLAAPYQRSRCPPHAAGGQHAAARLAGLKSVRLTSRFLRSTPIVEIDSQGFTSAAWSTLQRDGAAVVCPTTGQIEFFMHAKTGGRDNSVAYAKIPGERTEG